jgi:ABC-type glycerol-3-phosphate transport system substrate-binding protein
MKRTISVVITAAVVAALMAATIGAIASAPARTSEAAALSRKLDLVYRKLTNLERKAGTLESIVKKNQTETNGKLFVLEHDVTNIGYETARIWRCVRHLGGYEGSCQ